VPPNLPANFRILPRDEYIFIRMKYSMPHNSLECPCCGEMRGPVEQRTFLKQIESEVPPKLYATVSGILLENVYWADAKKGLVGWACELCLQSQRAIRGEPLKQLFCDFAPHFAYFDKLRVCRDCGMNFTFSKVEQKHWYEHLRFWVQAEKVRCKVCQQLKKRHDVFSQLIAGNDYSDLNVVREITKFYLHSKEYQKAKHFLAIGKRNYVKSSVGFLILHKLLESVRQLEKEQ